MLKSTFHGKANVDLTKVVVGEVRIVGSRCGPFAPALRLLERGAVDVASLVEAEYPLSQAAEALAHAARPGGPQDPPPPRCLNRRRSLRRELSEPFLISSRKALGPLRIVAEESGGGSGR